MIRTAEDVKEMLDNTEDNQRKCHSFVEELIKMKPGITYQDATNLWLFKTIGELQTEVRKLRVEKGEISEDK
jgi:hypothetical protein